MINNDEELRNGAFQRRKDEMDANARIHWAKSQGLKEGTHLTKIRTAVNLFKEGQTPEFVSRITELPLEQVYELKQQFESEHMYVAEASKPYECLKIEDDD